MTKPTISWLQQTIAAMESQRDEAPFGISDDHDMTLEAFKLALAGMEAEPVGFIARHKETGKFGSYLHTKADWFKGDKYEVLSAYTDPAALTTSERAELENYRNAQVVPDELTREEYKRRFMEEENFDDTFRGGWNACRAAMQSGAVKDGWVMVPEEPTHEMLEAGDEQFGTYDVYRRMLAAAPQQEAVSSALEHGMSRYSGAMQKLADGGD